jgi:AraC-like DNA-binding protein
MLETGPGQHVVRTLPDACVDLTLHIGRSTRVLVTGAHRRARRWRIKGRMLLVGARLLPGAAALLGIDASTTRESWTPLERLLPAANASALIRMAARAPDTERRVAALEAFLSAQLLNRELDPRLAKALRHVFDARGAVEIVSLARHSGVHARTLGRLFEHAVGLSPKRFARIVRLQAALRALPESDNWARVAIDLGYHDQAHFIHDVRELFGATPRQLVALAARTR